MGGSKYCREGWELGVKEVENEGDGEGGEGVKKMEREEGRK